MEWKNLTHYHNRCGLDSGGRTSFDWPIYEICVETGLMRIDVCGKLDNWHIGDVAQIKDDHGNIYDADFFYLE